MIAAALVLLAITAVVGAATLVPPGAAGVPRAVAGALASSGALAATAVVALGATEAHGVTAAVARVLAVLAAMVGGSSCVTAVFAAAGVRGGGPPDRESDPDEDTAGALRGGLAIGILERAAIAVCVLTGFVAGLAVVVAAKGLARYPELRSPTTSEQFILGTFVSVLWAAACAGVGVALVT
ncbi:hypothetical protein P0W64_08875 [Tsukamurella sp. 8F]|uniref:hypothetical protein n=1 Tax=unclassified Tsukamurella TaxID=2633480 RepID=UPI0023BA0705|nr:MULTISPECIES: hypothetical protein [unclassified Tsukamurella]MDF0529280.1 hypothetical protein [Tsukamurella sp. 8J]MDF0586883.1 hypothetical protein [Tsukamurella sp. 8F]